ncbi:hypothetical protein [Saccharopolyspora sp. ASAGF58]|uniref:hypothetical protein n=1 Tax=Saccharopolyspora sp. ASAGF58 TaxID=2719023 RepID=UPI00143FE6EB|nr:hypothetical protein [Saccharopolyspora sp. ASAGF58]QIZ35329.1 hypothetical protein FDZ84_12195 [Saccharopolyspora sp. ASAGF58]
MPHRTFAPDCATTWRCSAKRCLFTDPDPTVVGQHEHDAHGPAWMTTDQAPQQPAAGVVSPQ